MPQRKSAKKELKKNKKRRQQNLRVKQQIKSAVKKLKKALGAKEPTLRQQALKEIYKIFDKSAGKGIIHPNKAARKKGRFTKLLNKHNKADK